ncbi:ABC transporter permease [Melittangium boletus]|uniref:Glycine/betaine ABC transporter permease n=1 Tax=Melittangium boletus DSM 14713 TaxID=1294270 RepID=A0A250I5S0_9BACT|nr:proline/glycine betaine ABC transporter permease [Melittangium boletus]ATB27189.1 glycine/betaine ABC transporter permease [Melittangium boletus DSM 14713]
MDLHIGDVFERLIDGLKDRFDPFFHATADGLTTAIRGLEGLLLLAPSYVLIGLVAAASWRLSGIGSAALSGLGLLLIDAMGLWQATMETLALVLSSALVSLMLGIPLGILASYNRWLARGLRPLLDSMQTMPAFVYLIPAVLFFRLGKVPGVVATVIFAMPPAVRLTQLGIQQVPRDVVEAAVAFGSTPRQLLWHVQLPIALPTLLAGVNQTLMLSLSMVVISAMIGAGGLGEQVLKGITQLRIGLGFESGIAVVILAIVLDRLTNALGQPRSRPT